MLSARKTAVFNCGLYFYRVICYEINKSSCRNFKTILKEHKVFTYRMNKVSEMSDDEVIRYCHWFYEENRLNDEWRVFRDSIESNYIYCSYLEEYIDDDKCNDLQMIAGNYLTDLNIKVDIEELKECCKDCKYHWSDL